MSMKVVKRKFKEGDKIWCVIENKYGITYYHRPCTVVRYDDNRLFVKVEGYETHFPVNEDDFDLINGESEGFYATVKGKYCKCIPCGYLKEKWVHDTYGDYVEDENSEFILQGNTICVVIFDKTQSKMGVAVRNKKDKWNLKTGVAIAYARAKGIEIPKEVLA